MFLFDCGEGTQRQLRLAGISPARITKIFLSHWHGDHFFGLPGLLENLAKHKEDKRVEIYGPRGTKRQVKRLVDAFLLKGKIAVAAHDLAKSGIVVKGKGYVVRGMYLQHSTPCVGYAFEEGSKRNMKMDYLKKLGVPQGPILKSLQMGKSIVFRGRTITAKEATHLKPGRKVAIISDTSMCTQAITLAKGADLLICESTFDSSMKEKARAYKHLTAEDAGVIAKKGGVKRLVLTHFSQRYKSSDELEREAKKIFKNATSAHDFLKLTM